MPAADLPDLREACLHRGGSRLHRSSERLQHPGLALQYGEAARRSGPGRVMAVQTLLQLTEARLEHLPPLLEPGVGRASLGDPLRQMEGAPV